VPSRNAFGQGTIIKAGSRESILILLGFLPAFEPEFDFRLQTGSTRRTNLPEDRFHGAEELVAVWRVFIGLVNRLNHNDKFLGYILGVSEPVKKSELLLRG